MPMDQVARALAINAANAAAAAMTSALQAQGHAVTATVAAAMPIPAGALVNLCLLANATMMRLADASDPAKAAHGFAPAAVAQGAQGAFVAGGVNGAAGLGVFAADLWLSDTTPGTATATPPATSGHLLQRVGMATPDLGMIVAISPASLL